LEFAKELRRSVGNQTIVLGPAMEQTIRINNKYSAQVLIKYRDESDIVKMVNELVDKYATDELYITIDNFPNVG
jgi:primosomal protein N'